jgi:hypothetical protein
MSTIAERVAAGAAFLDEHDPDWWRADVERAIDLGTLAMWRGDCCVLGQRCPIETMDTRYIAYARQLSGFRDDNSALLRWAQGLGFYAAEAKHGSWDLLTAEWKRVITGRRAAS